MISPGESYFFEHVLTQEAAYGALLEHNRRLLHRAAAEAYQKLLVPGSPQAWDYLPPLARHLQAAGEFAAAHSKYCEILLLMSQTGRYQHWDATLQCAQACWERLQGAEAAGSSAARSGPLLHCLASRAYAEGRFAEAWPLLEDALKLAHHSGDEALAGAVLTAQGAVQQRQGDADAAESLYLQAMQIHERLGNLPAQCQVQRSLGILKRDRSEPQAAQFHSQRALELAQRCADPRLEAQVRIALGNESKMYRTFAEGGEHMARGYQLACASGDVEAQTACLAGLAEVHLVQGQYALAIDEVSTALALARATGNPRSISFALNVLGAAQGYSGDLDTGRRTLEESLGVSAGAGYIWGRTLTLQYLGRILRLAGDLNGACQMDREASELAGQLGHAALRAAMLTRSAEWLLETAELSPLLELLQQTRAGWSQLCSGWSAMPHSVSIRASLRAGDLSGARAEMQLARKSCAEFQSYPQALPLQDLQRAAELLAAAEAGA